MSMFDDPFDRDGDGHLDFDEEAERDYWYFDRDEENNSQDDDTYGGSGNSGHFYYYYTESEYKFELKKLK